jgi:hypothetical protein
MAGETAPGSAGTQPDKGYPVRRCANGASGPWRSIPPGVSSSPSRWTPEPCLENPGVWGKAPAFSPTDSAEYPFFYLTNDTTSSAEDIVYSANDRCHQENLLQQLKTGLHALTAPVDNLESNWAYMVMSALAWNLKAWAALVLPETPGRWQAKHHADKQWLLGLEFKAFLNAMVALPCQLIRQGRRLVFRILAYNPHLAIFFRLVDALRC